MKKTKVVRPKIKPENTPSSTGKKTPSKAKKSKANTGSPENLKQCDFEHSDACDGIERQLLQENPNRRSPYLNPNKGNENNE